MKRQLTAILFLTTLVLTACGASNTEVSQSVEHAAETGAAMDVAPEEAVEEKLSTTTGGAGESVKITDISRKLIKNVNISAETREFDALLDTLIRQVSKLEGYIQTSEINGNNYNNHSNRYATYVIRIPAERLDEFITTVKDSANITHESENVDDVTLQYVDIESHIKALKTEQESLMKMLEAANKLNDIIKIQSRLTEVRYEIESYESQLRTYDNLVSYSTVHLDISEVERETVTEEELTFGGSIKERFGKSLYNIKEGSKKFIVWLIGSLPYIIICAVILGLIVLAIRKIDGRYKKREMKRPLESINPGNDIDVEPGDNMEIGKKHPDSVNADKS